jgi:hypothetical protein
MMVKTGTYNSTDVCQFLKKLKTKLDEQEIANDGHVILFWDGAPTHTSNVTIAFLHKKHINCLFNDSHSPQLNPC